MQSFPLFMTLQDRRALVVGGTEAAVRKAELLLSAGARVTLIAHTVVGAIAQLIAEGRICWAGRGFDDGDLLGMSLVIVATEDEALQARVSHAAQQRCVPVNVVDRPALSSFIMPAIVDRAPITIAISTGGAAPALARRLRAEIERVMPAAIGRLARFAEIFREQVRRTLDRPRDRRRFWDRVFAGRIGELALAGDEIGARRELIRLLDSARKQRGSHCMSQAEINDRLVSLARAGKSVVRLKGGDPFVFGRGGEEVEALMQAGIAVEVVPGVTAALGCAASAGIPLTHRDHAQACVFVTGHLKDGPLKDGKLALDWPMLARPRQTVVIYMGAETLPVIASQLMEHGLPPATPVALIENGTTTRERRVVGTLATIERQAMRARLQGPTLFMVGEVIGLALARDPEFRFESRIGL